MTLQKRFESRIQPEPNSGCWLWDAGYSSTGYGAIRVKGKQVGAHRVAHELYIGPIPDGMHVCHVCDNRACVNPDHLWLGTSAENAVDKSQKGRAVLGTKHPKSKLTENQVLEILKDDRPASYVAQKYGVSRQIVWRIKTGKNWPHLTRSDK